MSISLEMRLNSTILKKNLAIKKKQRNEAFARAALAYEETLMGKLEESNRLKQEAAEISKPLPELADSDVLFKKGSGYDHDQSANSKQIKSTIGFSEAGIKTPHQVADITRKRDG
ncbi:hypothetical protein L1987_29084 [Smallanthus sonchifolius]|uniref:Uncharacterized protein n=1 Tax=Smallanthus sonchifolius TaxID=185202 RepID=A0ACB9HYW5_9ASTR|nr:hypothetical protein L1987_29084 [Smallanthus sonchifolius]